MSDDALLRLLDGSDPVPAGEGSAVFLDYLEARRAALIMELRQVDRLLVEHRRLKHETLERRIR
ncbi:MAG: hypothetical protein IPM49_00110 [Flavobacteriales bacterium]|nr:hypothetical protein [Flavobacteriales bacterium]